MKFSLSEIAEGVKKGNQEEYLTKLVIDRGQDSNPEDYLEQRKLQKRSQLPADVVDRKRDTLKRHYKVQDDYSALDGAFTTRKKIDGNPDVAKAINDEYGAVGNLERTVRNTADAIMSTFHGSQQSWTNSWNNIEINDITYREMQGAATPEDIARRQDLEDRLASRPDMSEDIPWIGNFPYYAMEFLPQLYESGMRSTKQASVGLAAGAAVGSAAPVIGTVGGGMAGMAAGFRAGMTDFNYRQESANAYREYSKLTDENGELIDPEAARFAAEFYGGVSAGLEMLGLESILTRLPGADKLVGGLSRDGIAAAMKVPTVRRAFVRAAKLWAEGAFVEGSTEALQALLQAGVKGGLTANEFGEADLGDPGQIKEDVLAGFKAGFYGGGGLTAPVAGNRFLREYAEIKSRKQQGEDLVSMAEAARDNQLKERDPELHDEIINETEAKAALFVEPEKLQTYLQESGISLEDFQEAAPITSAEYMEALEQDRTMEMDTAEFMRVFAGSDTFQEKLMPYMRKGAADALSMEEYGIVQQDQEALAAEYKAIMEADQAESSNQVYSSVREQLVQAGEAPDNASHMAAVHAAFFKTQADKIGADPMELFKRMNIQVQHDNLAEPERRTAMDRTDAMLNMLRGGNIPTQRDMYGKSLVQFLIDKGGILDEGQELTARDLDKVLQDYGNRKLARPTGVSMETAYEFARDEGYVPAGIPSNELLDYIDREMQGNPVYSQSSESSANINLGMELEDLERTLLSQGLNISNLTNKQIRDHLATQTLYQAKMSTLTPKEKRIVQKQLKRTDHPDQVKQLLKDYADTPWASQAIEAALTREAIDLMLKGKPVEFRNAFNSTSASVQKWKAAIERDGYDAIKNIIVSGGFIGHPEKPGQAVNSSFLNCEPSEACAKYCYAVTGNYVYSQNVIRSELVTMLVEKDPVWAAGQVATEYQATAEFMMNKALRMYDKGDGSAQWIPFYKELEAQGVRAQIFSKRPEILRQVSDYHLRLLSVDSDSHAMSDGAKDLPWAYVYGGTKAEADYINANQDNIQVVLPIKLGHKFLTKDQINLLEPSLRPYVCPVDTGAVSIAPSIDVRDKSGNIVKRWSLKNSKTATANMDKAEAQAKKIGGKTHRTKRQDWRCTDCDQNRGMGCFHGAATGELKKAQESGQVTPESMEAIRAELTLLSADNPELAQQLATEFHTLLRQVREGSVQKSEGATVQEPPKQTGADGLGGSQLIPLKELFQAVYHGTHARDIKRFTMDKINSGEGAQVYGWGMYFASRKGVAEWYRESVTERRSTTNTTKIDAPDAFLGASTLNVDMFSEVQSVAENYAWHHGMLRGDKFKDFVKKEVSEVASIIIKGMGIAKAEQWVEDNWDQFIFEDTRTNYMGMPTGVFMHRMGGIRHIAEFFDQWEKSGATWESAQQQEITVLKQILENLDDNLAGLRQEQADIVARMQAERDKEGGLSEQDIDYLYGPDLKNVLVRMRPLERRKKNSKVKLDWLENDFDPDQVEQAPEPNQGQLYVVDVPDAEDVLYRDALMRDQPPGVIEKLVAAGLLPAQDDVAFPPGYLSQDEFQAVIASEWQPLFDYVGNPDNAKEGYKTTATWLARHFKQRTSEYKESGDVVDYGAFALEIMQAMMAEGVVSRDYNDPGPLDKLESLVEDNAAEHDTGADFGLPISDPVYSKTGATFYDDLSHDFRQKRKSDKSDGDRQASLALNEAGVPGLRYDDYTRGRGGDSSTQNYVIWNEDTIEIVDQLYQDAANGDDYQGKIEFPEDKSFFRITLTGKADLSTFLHESGHLFLETLNLINRDSPTAETTQDLQAIFSWLGVDNFSQIETKHHEQFARGFEAYLMEGKAPSIELQDAFARFKLWLKRIYSTISKVIAQAGGPGLTDEVRGVMDRMLASEEQIKLVEKSEGLFPLFTDQEDMGVSEEQYAAYKNQYSKGHAAAIDTLERKALAELARTRKTEYLTRRKEVQEQVTEAVDNAPAQQAKHFFRTGEFRDQRKVPEAIAGRKMSTQGVLDLIPDPAVLKKLSFLHNKSGLHPNDLAPFFGFQSGDQMLQAIQLSKPRGELIKEQTDAQMRRDYPDMMDDGRLTEEAIKSLHNNAISNFIMSELKALGKKVSDNAPHTPLAVIKMAARQAIAETKLKDLRPEKYRQAEQRNARLALEATARKDYAQAREHKRRQLQNHWMYREGSKAKDQFEKIRQRMQKYTTPKERAKVGKASATFLDAIDTYLEGIDFRKISAKAIRKRQGLAAWIADQEAQGQVVVIPDKLRDESQLKSYKDMTLPELQDVQDAVLHIAHLARLKTRMTGEAERRSLDAAAEGLIANLKLARPTAKMVNADPHRNALQKGMEVLGSMHSDLIKAEFITRWMDNGDAAGMAHEMIFRPMREAQADKMDMQKVYTRKIVDMFRQLSRADKARLNAVIEFQGKRMKVKDLYSIALNLGNEGNKFKLLAGYGWTEGQVMEVLEKHLTADDFNRIQQMWDLIETLWPKIEALHKRNTGLAPPKVDSVPLKVTPKGGQQMTLSGGYYPVVYDRRLGYRAEQNSQKTGTDLFENNFMRPGVSKGFTESRKDSYYAPVLLSMDVIPNHLNEVIHFITHYDAVTNVDKLLNHPKLRKEIIERLGQNTYKQFRPWLQAIANDGVTTEETSFVEKSANSLRIGTTVMSMGLSLTTPVMQIFGLANVAAELGPIKMAKGIGALFHGNVFENIRNIEKVSGEFRHVKSNFDRDVKSSLDTAFNVSRVNLPGRRTVADWAFGMIGYVQSWVSAMAWQSGYQVAIEEGRDHTAAIMYADAIMSQTQSGGAVKDLAAVQRGNGLRKLFTAFYTYFSVLYNNLTDAGINVKQGNYARATQQAVFLIWVPVILERLMREGLPDDEEEMPEWLLDSLVVDPLLYTVTTIPFIRDIVSGTLGDYGYSMAPVAQVMERGTRIGKQMIENDTADWTEPMLEGAVDLTTVFTKVPLSKPYDYATNFKAYLEGDQEEPVREILFGPPRD